MNQELTRTQRTSSSAMSKAHALLLLVLLAPGLPVHAGFAQTVTQTCQEIRQGAPAASNPAAKICALIEGGRLEEMRWPDCSSYRKQVERFYAIRGYALAWVQEGRATQQAKAMIDLFRTADKKGLDPEDYDASRWPPRLEALAAFDQNHEEPARFDFALTVSSLRYISDLHQGRVAAAECEVNLPQKQFDGPKFLREEMVQASDVGAAVAKLDPPFEGYRRTLAALERYSVLAQQGDGAPLPPIRGNLRPGEPYNGVQQLAARLRQLGDLPGDAAVSSSPIYQEPLVTAVKQFEQRHGVDVDGIIGPATFEQLNVPLSRRVTQIKLSLERWRWLPHDIGRRVLMVNIAEFRLRAYDDDRLTLTMKAIVGKALEHPTPIFADQMESIIFRPYWNVPTSIQRNELVPILRRNPGYLAKHKMDLVNASDEVIVASAAEKTTMDQLASGKLRVRQQPGPANSLGLIKFSFPNQFGVYMHGTPEHGLFFEARRDFSHGCIRIEDPATLAGWVLRDRPEWTHKRIVAAMTGQKQISVRLMTPIPVLILYGTVSVEENGEVRFVQDIYANDAKLEKALAGRQH
jgi:L,D-transpeptidase YcbB